MQEKLPLFEGAAVIGAELKLTGKSSEKVGALDIGEEVFAIARGYVESIKHQQTGDGIMRQHVVHIEETVLLKREDGQRMIDEANIFSDERFGLAAMFARADLAIAIKTDPETDEDDEEGHSDE